jgi:hypothetical protein
MKKSVVVAIVLASSFICSAERSVNAAMSLSVSTATTTGWTVSGGGAVGAAPFLAATNAISLTSDGTSAGTPVTGLTLATFDGFWVADYTFVIPAGATNPSISISSFFADDRSILKLNGNIIANVAVDGSGSGSMVETDGVPAVPLTFTNGSTGAPASDFVLGGTNTIEAVINNTVGGKAATLANIGTSNGTNFGLSAVVSFNPAASVPVPAAFSCGLATILGIAGVGMLRRRIAAR